MSRLVLIYAADEDARADRLTRRLRRLGFIAARRNPEFWRGETETKAIAVYASGQFPAVADAYKAKQIRAGLIKTGRAPGTELPAARFDALAAKRLQEKTEAFYASPKPLSREGKERAARAKKPATTKRKVATKK